MRYISACYFELIRKRFLPATCKRVCVYVCVCVCVTMSMYTRLFVQTQLVVRSISACDFKFTHERFLPAAQCVCVCACALKCV